MTFTKKLTRIVAGFALLLCAFLFCMGTGALAGSGCGASAQITSLKEFKTFLDSIDSIGTKRSVLNAAQDGETENAEETDKYTSFTMVETTDAFSSSASHSNGTVRESSSLIRRILEMNADLDAVWYKSEGKVSSRTYSSVEHKKYGTNGSYSIYHTTSTTIVNMDFKVQIYMAGETVLLYVEKFDYTYTYWYHDENDSENNVNRSEKDMGINVLKENLYKWIDCSSEPSIARTFLNINDSNLKTLAQISRIIGRSIDGDEKLFKEQDNIYSLKTEPMMSLYGVPEDSGDFDGRFELDLSDGSAPVINSDINFQYHTSSNASANIADTILFKNINNVTVGKFEYPTVDIKDLEEE